MIKSNSTVSVTVAEDRQSIQFTALGSGSVTLHIAKVSVKNREHAALHGFIQKVRDGAAIARSAVDGKSATPTEKLNAMRAIVEHLELGTDDWSSRTRAGGRIGADESYLSIAMQELYPEKSADEVRAFVVGKTAEERKALLMVPKIKAIVDRIKGDAVKDVDAEALLAGF